VWEWLSSLSGGAATFIGSLTGSAIGLIALLIGALFNAHLNRKRDDRLREVDARGVAVALQAELGGIREVLTLNAEGLEKAKSDFTVPDVTQLVRIFPQVLPKITLLNAEIISAVADAYVMIEQHIQTCILIGCTVDNTSIPNRRMLLVRNAISPNVAKINRHTVELIEKAIAKLDSYLRR